MKPSFAIIGCGKVGIAFGKFLSKAGYHLVGLSDENKNNLKEASNILNIHNISSNPCKIIKKTDVVFITTPDGIIEDACKTIASHKGFKKDSIILHCSGALSSTILSSAKICDTFTGSIHPLQSFVSKEYPDNPFKNILFAVEGDDKAVEITKKMANNLDANSIIIKTDDKISYHASAVVASNYLVTLMGLSYELLENAGIPSNEAFEVLKPLINRTLNNIKNNGIKKSLTGPIIRGDVKTVAFHVEEIANKKPDFNLLYKILGKYTIKIAYKNLSKKKIAEFNKILK